MAHSVQVVFDCADPASQAQFWSAALGYQVQAPPDGYDSWDAFLRQNGMDERIGQASAIVDPDGAGPRIYFQRVPEAKVGKNRVHLDINVVGRAHVSPAERHRALAAAAESLVALGAAIVRPVDEEADEYWVVLQDPEGNEFCVQ